MNFNPPNSVLFKVGSTVIFTYCIAGKFDEFGESFVIHQTKTIKLILTINNLLADLLICQTFSCQMLEKSQFAKLSPVKLSCYTAYHI